MVLRKLWEHDLAWSFRRSPVTVVAALLTVVCVAAAAFSPWLSPQDPFDAAALDLNVAFKPPAWTDGGDAAFPLGTDNQGRDILSTIMHGARISLGVGLISQSVATVLGVTLGLIAGYYGKWVDAVVMRLADITLAFPTLLLLIAVAAAVRPSLPVVFMLIGVVGWAGMARLVRSQVLVLRTADYVMAARALGARDRQILLQHLLPNVRGPVIVAATLGIAGAMMAEAALSFVGLGAQPPTPSWGAMVADGRDLLRVAPWVSVAPGLAIGFAVLGFNLVGDALRELYDPKLRNQRA